MIYGRGWRPAGEGDGGGSLRECPPVDMPSSLCVYSLRLILFALIYLLSLPFQLSA